jgi:hypothetical protein
VFYWCIITAFVCGRLVVSGGILGDDPRLIAIFWTLLGCFWSVFADLCSVFVQSLCNFLTIFDGHKKIFSGQVMYSRIPLCRSIAQRRDVFICVVIPCVLVIVRLVTIDRTTGYCFVFCFVSMSVSKTGLLFVLS